MSAVRTPTVICGCGRDLSRGIQMGKYGGKVRLAGGTQNVSICSPSLCDGLSQATTEQVFNMKLSKGQVLV